MNITTHHWAYSVNGGRESTIHSGSTDPEEIRGLVAGVFHCEPALVNVRRLHDRP